MWNRWKPLNHMLWIPSCTYICYAIQETCVNRANHCVNHTKNCINCGNHRIIKKKYYSISSLLNDSMVSTVYTVICLVYTMVRTVYTQRVASCRVVSVVASRHCFRVLSSNSIRQKKYSRFHKVNKSLDTAVPRGFHHWLFTLILVATVAVSWCVKSHIPLRKKVLHEYALTRTTRRSIDQQDCFGVLSSNSIRQIK